MLRAALDDGVTRLHSLGDTVVKLERYFPGQDYLEVDSRGPVKSWTFREVALIILPRWQRRRLLTGLRRPGFCAERRQRNDHVTEPADLGEQLVFVDRLGTII